VLKITAIELDISLLLHSSITYFLYISMALSIVEALQRIYQTGGYIVDSKEACQDCTSQPACRQVSRTEHTKISPGSPTCQRVTSAEAESRK